MGNNSAKHNLKWNIKISLCFCIILISLSLNQFGSVSYVLNQPLSVIKILDSWNDEYLFAYWWRTCAMEEKIFRQCLKRHISKLLSRFLQKAVYSSFHLYFCTNQQEISSCRMTWHVCGRISQKQVLLSQSPRPFYSCEVDDGRNSCSFWYFLSFLWFWHRLFGFYICSDFISMVWVVCLL